MPVCQDQVEQIFGDPALEHFLLEDVGFVKMHHFTAEGVEGGKNWGIIESQNGDVLFFSKNIAEYFYNWKGDLLTRKTPRQLEKDTPVTFRVVKQEDGRMRAPLIVPFNPEELHQLRQPDLYRFLENRALGGGTGPAHQGAERHILWEGINLEHLRQTFPQDRWPCSDDFRRRRFEQYDHKAGAWGKSTDPR